MSTYQDAVYATYESDQGLLRTLEHEAEGFPRHAAGIDAHTRRSESRCCRCHQVSSAGDVATATDDGAAGGLDKTPHRQVCSDLAPQCILITSAIFSCSVWGPQGFLQTLILSSRALTARALRGAIGLPTTAC